MRYHMSSHYRGNRILGPRAERFSFLDELCNEGLETHVNTNLAT